MCELVLQHGAHLGLALDGDADRVLFCDEMGKMVDGDQVLALIAGHCKSAGTLTGNTVVATVMSNLGLERYLKQRDINLIRTAVGDRYVVEKMREAGYVLGGEQSGHIILGHHATTGDGIIAGLQVLAALVASGKPASRTLRLFEPVPQLLRNVRLSNGRNAEAVLALAPVKGAIAAAEQRLDGRGRLVIRKSGTEPLIRIMAEGDDAGEVTTVVGRLVDVITGAVA
jgi:phosphoglucosamine mutase